MKRIGLIGGLSPESTVEYYQYICRRYNNTYGRLNFPEIIVCSINLQDLIGHFDDNRWDLVADILITAIVDCEKAGAQFVAICANTPHNAYDAIVSRASIKVLSIMEVTAKAIRKEDISKVGLLGTKSTMEYGFFQKTFEKFGIETLIPNENDRMYINQNIWNELSHGSIKKEDREKYKHIIDGIINQGAQGIILGCTELPLLIKEEDSSVPLFDTMKIHARAILDYAVDE